MTIQIRYAKESDSAALGGINVASFRHQLYWGNAFPSIADAQIVPLKEVRALEKMGAPQVHVLTSVDTADRPVGYARWTIPGETNPHRVELSDQAQAMVTNLSSLIPAGVRTPLYEEFFRLMKESRNEYVKEDDMILDFLATLPEAQGKGVGTKLLQWGMEQADARDARVYLEATQDGYPLYSKFGWERLEDLVIDFEPFEGKGQATGVSPACRLKADHSLPRNVQHIRVELPLTD
ncbi:hypothetical protein FE257_005402 [Aspergillus nanangensis]|uniref:N-acetyltransferase domain-containing protein n=1 Tax=Aspergillus nanangensis TaxID=2582783 RepID=A0AAD4GVI7_ASPNN|nr:hypothetical protein FE257_005402 [Aspergillus nanangensis]